MRNDTSTCICMVSNGTGSKFLRKRYGKKQDFQRERASMPARERKMPAPKGGAGATTKKDK